MTCGTSAAGTAARLSAHFSLPVEVSTGDISKNERGKITPLSYASHQGLKQQGYGTQMVPGRCAWTLQQQRFHYASFTYAGPTNKRQPQQLPTSGQGAILLLARWLPCFHPTHHRSSCRCVPCHATCSAWDGNCVMERLEVTTNSITHPWEYSSNPN